VLILDEPTRGVDVGAKAQIHALVGELAAQGVAVLLISSELPELLHLATRMLVLRDGRLVGELSREDATQDAMMRLMAGVAA
jgi:ABC-type sugar transport system ATPase subunit